MDRKKMDDLQKFFIEFANIMFESFEIALADEIETLEREYADVLKDLEETWQELDLLKEDEKVKKFFLAEKRISYLESRKRALSVKICGHKDKICKHIYVITDSFSNELFETVYRVSCVKCNLNSTIERKKCFFRTSDEFLDVDRSDIITDIVCSLELAKGIYQGIVRKHPDITDEQAVLYLRQALYNIREKKVTEGVRKRRIRRLGLTSDFHKW